MKDTRKWFPGSLVKFRIRERNGAFGLAAPVGERAGERTEQKAEWSGGFRNSSREPPWGAQVCEFRGVVFQGESKARSLARWGGRWRHTGGNAGAAIPCRAAGAKRDHRSRSKWASKRNGRVIRLCDKVAWGAVGVRQFRGVEPRTKEKGRRSETGALTRPRKRPVPEDAGGWSIGLSNEIKKVVYDKEE